MNLSFLKQNEWLENENVTVNVSLSELGGASCQSSCIFGFADVWLAGVSLGGGFLRYTRFYQKIK